MARAAADARTTGDFARAIDLYVRAEATAGSIAERLHLAMRRAYCLIDIGRAPEGVVIAQQVVIESRTNGVIPELCDALGLLVDEHMLNDRIAEATNLLAEARYLLDQVPDDPTLYQVVHNLAVTYERCDFPEIALELFDRAIRLAENSVDRTFVYSAMANAYHLAMMYETDPAMRVRHATNGLRVANAVLDSTEAKEAPADTGALGHRAVFLNECGRHTEALADAKLARKMADDYGWNTELVVALLGEAIARWNLDQDLGCIELIESAWAIADGPWARRFSAAASEVHVEALRALGDQARVDEAIARRQRALEDDLRRERAGRLAHVQLGVEHRHTERISETDPLTGLYNRRYLAKMLPDALERFGPICVAVFDLDGFKVVNDEYSYEQGDRLIQQMAAVLSNSCRAGDCVGRLGGDEFVMVLCQITPLAARTVLERVRELIGSTVWDGLPAGFSLTSSVGVAVGTVMADAHRVIADAAQALRLAKRAGRDRISFAA